MQNLQDAIVPRFQVLACKKPRASRSSDIVMLDLRPSTAVEPKYSDQMPTCQATRISQQTNEKDREKTLASRRTGDLG